MADAIPVEESPVADPQLISVTVKENSTDKNVNNNVTSPTSNGEATTVDRKRSSMDDVVPATNSYTTQRDGAVKLKMGDTGPSAMKPITVQTLFRNTLSKSHNAEALAVKRGGQWVKWTYQQYYDDVRRVAKGLIKLGLEPYHGVGIIGFNSPEWFFSDLGAIYAGGFATGIYTTNTAEACEYVLSNCEANVVVVENHPQLKKILQVWDNLPHLKAIVQYTGDVAEKRDNIYSWQEFMELAKDVSDEALQERCDLQAPNKACTLIYTSGTTGNPKGVMLSHDNLTWTAKYFGRYQKPVYGEEVVISYLPLSHVAGQMIDMYIPITYGATVYFAEKDALKGSIVSTMREVRPTVFLGVPRVWEKFMEKMQEKSRQVTGLKKKFGAWAKGKGRDGVYARMENRSLPWFWGIANNFLFKPIKKQMGLDRCRICISAAAPIMKETIEFFYTFDITLLEVYGMSESSGPHSIGANDNFRICSVGKEITGVQTKLADTDEDGNGEVCMSGRHVCMGYLNSEEKTAELFDQDGWLLSGDIGKKDKDGFLYITGRKKELIITAGGENVAPVPVEDNVKEALPCLSNCMLIGDKRKFLSMLLTMKVTADPETGEPSEMLSREAVAWCESLNSSAKTVSDIVDKQDEAVLHAIQLGIDKANERAVSRANKIQKWSILPTDFSIPGGELGPTLKLRRPIATKKYAKTIDAFYTET